MRRPDAARALYSVVGSTSRPTNKTVFVAMSRMKKKNARFTSTLMGMVNKVGQL
jgi:hypothetical protein